MATGTGPDSDVRDRPARPGPITGPPRGSAGATTSVVATAGAPASDRDRRVRLASADRRPRWWTQLLLVVAFYWLYARIRDLHGTYAGHAGSRGVAQSHGLGLLHLEQWLHIDVELGWQRALLHYHWLVRLLGGYYGSAHFLVTAAVFAYLLVAAPPARYRYWRNTLAVATGLGLVCFALYPTMSPRLLPASYGYVDTLKTVGGLWSYNHGVLEHISDPFAALPSLHIVWSGWCSLALWWRVRSRAGRAALVAYPLLTGYAVIITGNHWVLDLVAGAVVLLAGVLATSVAARRLRSLRRPAEPAAAGSRG